MISLGLSQIGLEEYKRHGHLPGREGLTKTLQLGNCKIQCNHGGKHDEQIRSCLYCYRHASMFYWMMRERSLVGVCAKSLISETHPDSDDNQRLYMGDFLNIL